LEKTMNLPSLRHLRHLLALVDHGHFGRAAAASGVTQSTLSVSIKELESLLEAMLIDRSKRRVALTPLGLETAERARRITREVEELALAARAAREPLTGVLRMGVIPTIGPFLLPRALPGLRRDYEQLKLFLVEDLTARLVEALHRGELDVVLLALPFDLGAVETEILFDDPFVVALPPGHALASQQLIKPQRFWCNDLLLLKDGHCLRDHALAACRLADRHRTEAFEATSLATLVQMVDNGLGITLLPMLAVEAGLLRGTSLVTRPLISEDPARQIGLIWRRGTGRQNEFRLLATELRNRAKPQSTPSRVKKIGPDLRNGLRKSAYGRAHGDHQGLARRAGDAPDGTHLHNSHAPAVGRKAGSHSS
jgi:LysR family hydrogen peroxide-inducible transcriptional activator